jgi:O-antigen/teichoic acid export membrane protein
VATPPIIERLQGILPLRTFRQGSLRLNLLWTLTGNTVQLGSQWASVMVLARLGTPELVGEYSLALGLCAPVIVVSSLGLRNVLVTDAKRVHAYADMLGARVLGTATAMAVVAVIAASVAGSVRVFGVYVLLAAARCFDSLSDIYWAQLQRAERMDLIAFSQGLRGLLGIAALSVALALTGSLLWAAAALLAVSAAVWGLFDTAAVRAATPDEDLRPRMDPATLRKILAFTAPLVLSMLLGSVAGPMPRYFLQHFHGAREVGFFAVASSPIAVVGFIPAAIYQATAARAAMHMQSGDHRAFTSLAWKVLLANLAVAGAFYAGAALFGGVFLRALFSPAYGHLWPEMKLFCFAQLVAALAAFGSQVTNAARMFRVLAANSVLNVAALAVASALLVPRYGVRGTAYADIAFKGVSAAMLTAVSVWWAWSARRRA